MNRLWKDIETEHRTADLWNLILLIGVIWFGWKIIFHIYFG